MTNKKRIQYERHIPIILFLLVLHAFASEICLHFYLENVKNRLQRSENGVFYSSGEYEPLLEKDSSFRVPRDYSFVFVEHRGDVTEEIYYTKGGRKVEAVYINKKIQRVSGSSGPKAAYFVIPAIGFAFVLFAILRESVRAGKFFSWQIGKAPGYLEKLLYVYGIAFFGIGTLINVIKELWLK